MSLGGPIDSMQHSLAENRKLLRGKKRFKEIQQKYRPRNIQKTILNEKEEKGQKTYDHSRNKRITKAIRWLKLLVFIAVIGLVIYYFLSMDWNHIKDVIQ